MRPLILPTLASAIVLLAAGAARAGDAPVTGVFIGHGRGCWGGLYVRAKTIEWNTPYNICRRTKYRVLEQAGGAKPRAAFLLDRKNRQCRFVVIELRFDPEYPDYWQALGYTKREDFDNRLHLSEEASLRTLECGVQKR